METIRKYKRVTEGAELTVLTNGIEVIADNGIHQSSLLLSAEERVAARHGIVELSRLSEDWVECEVSA